MDILIKSGRLINPKNNFDEQVNIGLKNGQIKYIGNKMIKAREIVDATGLVVVPGLVDLHTHLREPGREDKETIKTGTRAAAKGGFTTILCMPNTFPVVDHGTLVEFIILKARREGIINVFPIGAATRRQEGKELAEIGEMIKLGAIAISDDGAPVMDSGLMRRIMDYTKMFKVPVISHCEDLTLSQDGVINEGIASTILGLKGIPAASEEIMIAREIALCRTTGSQVHIAHVSTKGSLELIKKAKEEGLKITCEVTPHHFTLTEEAVFSFDTNTKVKPPLRTKEDVKAIKDGIKEGIIDIIATDHAPHTKAEKECEYGQASFGIVGLETALSLALTELVEKEGISLNKVIAMFTHRPAEIVNLDKGNIEVGKDADITIIDLNKDFIVDVNQLASKSKNSPFHGWRLKGSVWATIVKGKIVFRENSFKV
ncbi:dihydroorotase [bacterium]|nr:dihydroorotase [bacterium]MBU1782241.1 dihydroorotase [bacterium]